MRSSSTSFSISSGHVLRFMASSSFLFSIARASVTGGLSFTIFLSPVAASLASVCGVGSRGGRATRSSGSSGGDFFFSSSVPVCIRKNVSRRPSVWVNHCTIVFTSSEKIKEEEGGSVGWDSVKGGEQRVEAGKEEQEGAAIVVADEFAMVVAGGNKEASLNANRDGADEVAQEVAEAVERPNGNNSFCLGGLTGKRRCNAA